jgi:predicted cobalt transporter CbtA
MAADAGLPDRHTECLAVRVVPFAALLRAVIVAALVAGAGLGAFHLVVSEPIVERAIAREEAAHQGEDHGQEVYSRRTQKLGLVAGALTYALSLGLIFGGVYAMCGERLPGGTPRRRALVLAAAGLWVLYVAPFIKYPGNPPGVGDPDTVYARQGLYLAFLVLATFGLVVAGLFARSLRRGGARPATAAGAALAAYAVYFAALCILMPGNPDSIDAPSSLLFQFRAASLAGAALFWTAFGLVFAAVLRRAERLDTRTRAAT